MLDGERERLLREVESDPHRRELLRAILLAQDQSLAGQNVILAAHRFPRSRELIATSFQELVDRLGSLGLEKTMDTDDEFLLKLSALPDDVPTTLVARLRWLLSRPQAERQEAYDFANRFSEMLFDSFKRHFPERDPSELWEHSPANDESIHAEIALLEANVQ